MCLALLKLARCRAAPRARDFVIPEDVKAVAVPALVHRLTLRPELWVQRVSPADVVRQCLEMVPNLQRRDRVGMVGFGGTLRWLMPAMGMVQRYRIVESLIDTDIVLSYAWKGVDIIPRSTLPPKALVIAFSPLLDERSINALFDLRARGFDLAIIEVSPLPFVTPEAGEQGQIAFRLWKLERDARRYRFQGLGVAVAMWERGQPLERVLAEVQRFRRYARRARQTRV